jgi:hypothetical protein
LEKKSYSPSDYYYGFFNPAINGWLREKVTPSYRSDFRSYTDTRSLGASRRSIVDRAGYLKSAPDDVILGYMEQHALMQQCVL